MVALWAYGFAGDEPNHLRMPLALDIDEHGRTWVADLGRHVLMVYEPDGSVINEIDLSGLVGDAESIGVDPTGRVHLIDPDRATVVVLNPDGGLVDRYGIRGDGVGEFLAPSSIAFDDAGRAHIPDSERGRVLVFDHNGNFDTEYGSPTPTHPEMLHPEGIAFDSGGRSHVVDQFADQVHVFDPKGEPVFLYPTGGDGPREFEAPADRDRCPRPRPGHQRLWRHHFGIQA